MQCLLIRSGQRWFINYIRKKKKKRKRFHRQCNINSATKKAKRDTRKPNNPKERYIKTIEKKVKDLTSTKKIQALVI